MSPKKYWAQMRSWETFVTKRTLITLITPISEKIIWASKSFTLIKEIIRCFHKTFTGISDQNIERMLTLTISRSYGGYKSKNLSEDSKKIWRKFEENSNNIRKKNHRNIFLGQLNINSLTCLLKKSKGSSMC